MININAKAKERILKGVKKFQPILKKAKQADINESDTVTIIVDILCDVFGYDKYENITSELAIKKTFCDLAIKMNDKIPLLLECKAIGIDLKDEHIKQATDYAANAGIEWVALTNGICWKVFKVIFAKPIENELVYEFDFCELVPKKQSDVETIYYLCKEAFMKTSKVSLEDLHSQKQILNRYTIGQVLLTDTIIDTLRRTMKRMYPDVKVENEELHALISSEVLKREIVEGEPAEDAKKKVAKAMRAIAPKKKPVEKSAE